MFSSPKSITRELCAIVLALVAGASSAAAAPMTTGGLTSQPIGHFEFCKNNPAECNIHLQDNGPERMTADLWQELDLINLAVNKGVKPMNDLDMYGKEEVWSYPHGAGDCEDYVLEKRRELAGKGISLSNLLITVVRKPDGEGHAVLTVRTDKGDFILDNLSDGVKSWSETDYRYLKRQSSVNTGRWVSIREGLTTLVGSVR